MTCDSRSSREKEGDKPHGGGTLNYMAPETLGPYRVKFKSKPTDIFSLGIMWLSMLAPDYEIRKKIYRINKSTTNKRINDVLSDLHEKKYFSFALGNLLLTMLDRNPDFRPTIDQVCTCAQASFVESGGW